MFLKDFLPFKVKNFSESRGVAAVILALLLPALIGSIYYAIHFAERTGRYVYVDKDCSTDAILTAVKKYNFAIAFADQKNNLLYYADKVYNDHAVSYDLKPIEYDECTVTFNKFYSSAYSASVYNQFVSMYSSIDGCYQNGWFYNMDYLSDSSYLTSTPKVYNVSIPNSSETLSYRSYVNLPFQADKPDAYNKTTNQGDNQHFGLYKTSSSDTFDKKVYKRKYESDTSILDIKKDGSDDTLTVTINEQSTGETYQATAAPEKCNVDIVLCIPTNGAACNVDNRDQASDNDISELPVSVAESTETISDSVKSTPIYQISQACKGFLLDNFFGVQGVNIGLIPYSGKLSIPHYKYTEWGAWTPAFIDKYYNNQGYSTLKNRVMGYHLYGTYGDSSQTLTHLKNGTNCDIKSDFHKYGVPIMYQKGSLSANSTYGGNYDLGSNSFDFTTIPSSITFNEINGFRICNMWPAYMGYANTLSGRADDYYSLANLDYQPNPYYIIELSRDILKICDMLECFRPIYDKYNISNFLWLPIYWANCLLNASWTEPSYQYSDNDWFEQENRDTSGRHKAVILFVNKPDHFEPNELTYLGFNNDNNELYLGESDGIRFCVNYGSSSYRFLDGNYLNSACSISTTSAKFYGPKKVLKFEQTGGILEKTGTDNKYYWHTQNGSTVTAKLTFPKKHLIRLVFEGEYVNEADSGTVTFYTDNIDSSYDVRKDSTSGTTISLGSAQTVTSSTKFVFKGGKMPTRGDSYTCLSGGPNFQRNCCVKKVKYYSNNTRITNCVLKNQIIRYYGAYQKQGTLIRRSGSTGTVATDSCTSYNEGSDLHISASEGTDIYVYGMNYPFVVAHAGWNQLCNFLNSSGTYTLYDARGVGDYVWTNSGEKSLSMESTDTMHLRFLGDNSCFYQFYVQNLTNKILKNSEDDPITSDPIQYQDLKDNKGVYLANYGGEKWICFQGDGELEVTVEPETTNGLYISNLKDRTNVLGAETDKWDQDRVYNGHRRHEYYIYPEAISDEKDSEGNYHLDLQMKDVRLISAEIMNRDYKKKSVVVSSSLVSEVKEPDTTTTDSQGRTIVTQGDTVRTYKIVANNKYRIWFSTSPQSKTRTITPPPATVTFYSDNGVSDCRIGSTTGTSVTLGSSYTVTSATDFVFKGGVMPTRSNHFDTNDRTTSTEGPNFGHNLSPYKVRYDLSNAEFVIGSSGTSCTYLQNQIIRDYIGLYNYLKNQSGQTPYKQLILSNGKLGTYYAKYMAYTPYASGYGTNISSGDYYSANTGTATSVLTNKLDQYLCYFRDTCLWHLGGTYYVCVTWWPEDCYFKLCYKDNIKHQIYSRVNGLGGTNCQISLHLQKFNSGNTEFQWRMSYWPQISGNTADTDVFYQTSANDLWSVISLSNIEFRQPWGFNIYGSSQTPSSADIGKLKQILILNSGIKYLSSSTILNGAFPDPGCYGTDDVSASTIPNEYMRINDGIHLVNLSSSVNDVPAGNWICFQGDGELHVMVRPKNSSTTETFYNGSIEIQTRRSDKWPDGDMWMNLNIYKDENLATDTLAYWNQSTCPTCSQGNYVYGEVFPEEHAYTRDENGNYVYIITLRNTKLYCKGINSSKAITFSDSGIPTNQRGLNLYKNASYISSSDIYKGMSTYYAPTELYPYISWGPNNTYGISSAYGSIYNKNYAGDGTLLVGSFAEYPYLARLYYSGKNNDNILISDCVRVFMKNFRNGNSSNQRFHLDNYGNKSCLPYYGWGYNLGTHFTYPKNLALDKYLEKYPSDVPTTNNYDQDSILRKVTQRCASNLKNSGNVKIYVVKYRKQSDYKDFPIYNSAPSSKNWDYDYLDGCASGNDYIYDCSNEEELENVLKSIAQKIKKDTKGYEKAHLVY